MAKPRGSRAESLLPFSPPTVEKRAKTGVLVPGFCKKWADVSLVKSAVTSAQQDVEKIKNNLLKL